MAKHSTKSKSTQDLQVAHTAQVELPLPMLSALEDIDRAFFGVCIEAGKQVLGAMMEHDRTALCGLPWKPDEERPGRRAGSTERVPLPWEGVGSRFVDLVFGRSMAKNSGCRASRPRRIGTRWIATHSRRWQRACRLDATPEHWIDCRPPRPNDRPRRAPSLVGLSP